MPTYIKIKNQLPWIMNLKELGDLMQLLFVKDLLKKKTEQANQMTTELLI
jgi:hypothetical protein